MSYAPAHANDATSRIAVTGRCFGLYPNGSFGGVLENNEVKVARALEKYQVAGKFHQHDMNRVMVYLQPGRQKFEYQDGRQPAVFDFKAGQVVWSPPTGMHSGEVMDHDFNIIEVELKTQGLTNRLRKSRSSQGRSWPLQAGI